MSVFLCPPEPCRIINYQYTFIHTIAVDLTADEYKLNTELRWNVMGSFFLTRTHWWWHIIFFNYIVQYFHLKKKCCCILSVMCNYAMWGPFLLLSDCLLCDVGMNIFMEWSPVWALTLLCIIAAVWANYSHSSLGTTKFIWTLDLKL